jgi:hypothetical protein
MDCRKQLEEHPVSVVAMMPFDGPLQWYCELVDPVRNEPAVPFFNGLGRSFELSAYRRHRTAFMQILERDRAFPPPLVVR